MSHINVARVARGVFVCACMSSVINQTQFLCDEVLVSCECLPNPQSAFCVYLNRVMARGSCVYNSSHCVYNSSHRDQATDCASDVIRACAVALKNCHDARVHLAIAIRQTFAIHTHVMVNTKQ